MTYLYLDSSAVLRYLYEQPGFINFRRRTEATVASALTEIECLRTLDRLRLDLRADPHMLQIRIAGLNDLIEKTHVLELNRAILLRAGLPLPLPLGTLDALHLASALHWRELHGEPVVMATHDRALARAARLHRLEVVGGDAA